MRFSFPSIEQEFLIHARPEYVYEYFYKKAAEQGAENKLQIPRELQLALLEKKHPIINLAIAQYTNDGDILEQLYKQGRDPVKIAVLSNTQYDPIISSQKWIFSDELIESVCKNLNSEKPDAYFKNPRLKDDDLANVFLKKGVYQKLSENDWLTIIFSALENPNILSQPEHIRFRDSYYHNTTVPLSAAWSLLLSLPNSRLAARILSERLGKLDSFSLPREEKNVKEYITKTMDRWREEKSADYKNGQVDDGDYAPFNRLREVAISKIYGAYRTNKDVGDFLLNHEDVWVRRGYYRVFWPTDLNEMLSYHKKDKNHFVRAAVYNENLYKKNPPEIRATLYQLVKNLSWERGSTEEIWNEMASAQFHMLANQLSQNSPEIYHFDEAEVASYSE